MERENGVVGRRLRLTAGLKALNFWLGTGFRPFRRARHSASPTARRSKSGRPETQPEPAGAELSLSLMEVVSALPPAQIPVWFKQRFEQQPVFRLAEIFELSPSQRDQLIVMLEKALDAHQCRTRQTSELVNPDGLSRFLEQAQRHHRASR